MEAAGGDQSQKTLPVAVSRDAHKKEAHSPCMSLHIGAAPTNLDDILDLEASLVLPRFTTTDAWALGNSLRARLHHSSMPIVINISLANSAQCVFHTVTRAGTAPDNDCWIARKRATVLRWGNSSWWMHCKMKGDEEAFREKYMLGNDAGTYAIHGGALPIRIHGVEGVVAVVVVSGLKQEHDHMVIVEAIQDLQKSFQ